MLTFIHESVQTERNGSYFFIIHFAHIIINEPRMSFTFSKFILKRYFFIFNHN